MKKVYILILALLLALTTMACDKDQPVTQEMTPQRMAEIEQAWQDHYGTWFGVWWEEGVYQSLDGVRYYGTCNGYDILYRPGYVQRVTYLRIGGVSFAHPAHFTLFAYQNGQFYSLQKLFDEGIVTKSQLEEMSRLHLVYESLLGTTAFDPQAVLDEKIKWTFLQQYASQGDWAAKDLSVVHYGKFKDDKSWDTYAYVCVINGALEYKPEKKSELIGGVVLVYPSTQRLLVYYKDELISLQEAYDRGVLTREDLVAIRNAHNPQPDNSVSK